MTPKNESNMGRNWLMAAACAAAVLILGVAAGFGLSQLVMGGAVGDADRSSNASTFETGVAGEPALNLAGRENAAKMSENGMKFIAGENVANLQSDDRDIYSSTIRLINKNASKGSQCLEATQQEDAIDKQLQLVECDSSNESQNWAMDIYGHIRPENSLGDCIVFNGPPDAAPTAINAVQLQSCASADLDVKQWLQAGTGHIRLRTEPEWCLDARAPPDGVVLSPCLYGSLGQWFSTNFPVAGPDVPAPTPAPTLPGPSSAPDDFNFYVGRNCDAKSIKAKTVSSAEACGEMCADDADCNAYSYKTSNQRCYQKKECARWKYEEIYVSGIMPYYDVEGDGAGKLICTDPEDEARCDLQDLPSDAADSSELSDSSSETTRYDSDSSSLSDSSERREDDSSNGEKECPEWSEDKEESADPLPNDSTFVPPYKDILDGEKDFVPTFPENRDFATCPFRPPTGPRPKDWADECIKNARDVGFLDNENNRPNKECPAGWFLCKGMCYTLVQRNSRGPSIKNDYYAPDYMSAEARCGICGGARVAFVGNDPEMEKVAGEAAAQTINSDKAVFVRRFRFLREPNPLVEKEDNPYQPWHRFVILSDHNDREATYQRYYTGEKDGLSRSGWDRGYRNQEGSILCVNTIDRINAATRTVNSRLSMENGCQGEDRFDRWDDNKHRWFPEHNWPYPGL